MKLRGMALSALVVLSIAGPANASLTASEKAQVKDFVARGQLENVGRVRSLVARTDLAEDETVGALVDAFDAVPFTEQRALFAKELVFGGASAASRQQLALGIVKALLARADAIYQKYVGGLDHEPKAAAEIAHIYRFLDVQIANAGKPTATAHDASAGITSATYEQCSKALQAHAETNAHWLKESGTIGEVTVRVRAQGQALLLDLLPDGTTRRVDAADRLGLKGARRQMLTDWGILLEDSGKLDDSAATKVKDLLAKVPSARTDLAMIVVGDDTGPIRARGIVLHAPSTASSAFPDDAPKGTTDTQLAPIAYELGVLTARRALEAKADLKTEAEKDALAAKNDPSKSLGTPRAPSVDAAVGSAIQLLLLDAPRTVALTAKRYEAGKSESVALLSDAIGALAAGNATTALKDVKVAPSGVATGFVLDGKTWTFDRSGPVAALHRKEK